MAVFTELSLTDAQRMATSHGLGHVIAIVPIAAGSVNSNFFLDCAEGRYFARIYEEQGVEGVQYEWSLLDHLHGAGLPVPRRIPGPAPGELSVAGKPTAVFELVHGSESCQAGVSVARARAVGKALGLAHRAAGDFPWRRQGRFTLGDVRQRLEVARQAALADPRYRELLEVERRLTSVLDEVESSWPEALPKGVIHGDLFRDNVRWEGERIVALIDWESASDGLYVYDVMVTVLAWCYGDVFEWELARALLRGYQSARPLIPAELTGLRTAALAATVRFTTTRITDFYLRQASGERVYKDYRRFLARLEAISAFEAEELARKLLE